jgi:lipopolysaccharide export system permease protein
MGSIDRYIFRTTLASFALVLVSLTGRDLDYAGVARHRPDDQPGQTIVTFLGVTSLVIPALVLIISPIAADDRDLAYAQQARHRFGIIVMNAAGLSPIRLFHPFLLATLVVALLVAFIASYLAPDGLRRLKRWDAEITADVLANILQPGRFAQLDANLTIRIRERQPAACSWASLSTTAAIRKNASASLPTTATIVKNEGGSFPDPRERKSRAVRGRQTRSGAGCVRPLRLRYVEVFQSGPRRHAGHSRTLLWELLSPPPTIRSTAVARPVPRRIA